MAEGRAEGFGRNWAEVIEDTIGLLPYSPRQKRDYLDILMIELEKYSFEPRKVGEPKNGGCVWELPGGSSTDIYDPVEYARFIREDRHFNYQKETSRRVMDSMLDELELLFDDL